MKRILILILVLQAAILQLVDAQVPGCSDAIPMVTNSEELVGEYTLTSTGSEIKLNYCEGEFSTDFYKIFKLPNGQYNGYVWTGNHDVSLYFAPCCGDRKCSPQYPISQWTGEINLLEAGFCVTSNSGYIIAWADQVETFRLYFRNNGGSVTCEEESYCSTSIPNCNEATSIVCGQTLNGDLRNETNNFVREHYLGCAPYIESQTFSGGDKIYSFKKERSSDVITLELDHSTSINLTMSIINCNSGGEVTNIECIGDAKNTPVDDSPFPDGEIWSDEGSLPPGTYYVVIDAVDKSEEGSYKLKFSCEGCPSEDCTKVAATLNCDNNERTGAINSLDGNEFNSNCSYRPSNCYNGDLEFDGDDEVIRIDIGDTPKDIVIDLMGLTGNLDMFLFDQCTTGEVSGLVGCIGNSIQSGTNSERISVPNASGTYYLVIDTYQPGISSGYKLTLTCEDDCEELTPSENCIVFVPSSVGGDQYDFTLLSIPEVDGATNIRWCINGGSEIVATGEYTTLQFPGEGSYEVCVKFEIPIGEGGYVCRKICKQICIYDDQEEACDLVDYIYTGKGFIYRFFTEGLAGDPLLYIRNKETGMANNPKIILDNAVGDEDGGVEGEITLDLTEYITRGDVVICFEYYDKDGCLQVCCKELCQVAMPEYIYDCGPGIITASYVGTEQEVYTGSYRYHFTPTLPAGSTVASWSANAENGGEGFYATSEEAEFLLTDVAETSTTYWVCCTYRTSDGCEYTCCINVCLTNPYTCYESGCEVMNVIACEDFEYEDGSSITQQNPSDWYVMDGRFDADVYDGKLTITSLISTATGVGYRVPNGISYPYKISFDLQPFIGLIEMEFAFVHDKNVLERAIFKAPAGQFGSLELPVITGNAKFSMVVNSNNNGSVYINDIYTGEIAFNTNITGIEFYGDGGFYEVDNLCIFSCGAPCEDGYAVINSPGEVAYWTDAYGRRLSIYDGMSTINIPTYGQGEEQPYVYCYYYECMDTPEYADELAACCLKVCCIPIPRCNYCAETCCTDDSGLLNIVDSLVSDCNQSGSLLCPFYEIYSCKYNGQCVYKLHFDDPTIIDEEGGRVYSCNGTLLFSYNDFATQPGDPVTQLTDCALIWDSNNSYYPKCDPGNCTSIPENKPCFWYTPVSESNALDYNFVFADREETQGASNIKWYVDGDERYSGKTPKMKLPVSGMVEICVRWEVNTGEITKCYEYCRKICIADPFNCRRFRWYPSIGRDDRLTFITDDEDIQVLRWDLHDDQETVEAIVGNQTEVQFNYGFTPGNSLYVTLTYYDLTSKCVRICCRKVCIPDKHIPVDQVDEGLQIFYMGSGGPTYQYRVGLDVPEAQDITWIISPESGEGSIIEADGPNPQITFPGANQTWLVCCYYKVNGCYYVKCTRLCIQDPTICYLFDPVWDNGILMTSVEDTLQGVIPIYWQVDQNDPVSPGSWSLNMPYENQPKYCYFYYLEPHTIGELVYYCWKVCCVPVNPGNSGNCKQLGCEPFANYSPSAPLSQQNGRWKVVNGYPECSAQSGHLVVKQDNNFQACYSEYLLEDGPNQGDIAEISFDIQLIPEFGQTPLETGGAVVALYGDYANQEKQVYLAFRPSADQTIDVRITDVYESPNNDQPYPTKVNQVMPVKIRLIRSSQTVEVYIEGELVATGANSGITHFESIQFNGENTARPYEFWVDNICELECGSTSSNGDCCGDNCFTYIRQSDGGYVFGIPDFPPCIDVCPRLNVYRNGALVDSLFAGVPYYFQSEGEYTVCLVFHDYILGIDSDPVCCLDIMVGTCNGDLPSATIWMQDIDGGQILGVSEVTGNNLNYNWQVWNADAIVLSGNTVSFFIPEEINFTCVCLVLANECGIFRTCATYACTFSESPVIEVLEKNGVDVTLAIRPEVLNAEYIWHLGNGITLQTSSPVVSYTYSEESTYQVCVEILYPCIGDNCCRICICSTLQLGCCTEVVKPLIFGNIKDIHSSAIKSASVNLSGPDKSQSFSDSNGNYEFKDLVKGQSYEVGVNHTSLHPGINILDVLRLQEYLFIGKEFDNSYPLIASDVNRDNKLNILDLLELFYFNLGSLATFTGSVEWEFIPSLDVITDEQAIKHLYRTGYTVSNLQNPVKADFVGVEVGNVFDSNSSIPSLQSREDGFFEIRLPDIQVSVGSEFELPVHIKSDEIQGFQFEVHWDPKVFQMTNVDQLLNLNNFATDKNFLLKSEIGALKISWFDFQPWSSDVEQVLCHLHFSVITKNAGLDSIRIFEPIAAIGTNVLPNLIKGSAITIDNNSVGYGKIDLPEGVKVYPIPAKQVLNIEMPDPSTKWLDIRNVLGELVIQNTKNDHGGSQINVLNWPRGSYFVRVLTNQGLRVIPILIQ